MNWLWLMLASFLCGSIPTGLVLGRLGGVDIRKHGSGNIGATNVWRVLGPKFGLPCFLLDVAKGFAPTILAGMRMSLVPAAEPITAADAWPWLAVMACAVLGHMFTPWAGFRGGKGVATGLGAMLGVYPYLAIAAVGAFAVWVVCAAVWRYVSLASCIAAATLPAWVWAGARLGSPGSGDLAPFYVVTGLLGVLVIVRHRSNIARLIRGTENRIGGRRPPQASPRR